MNYKSNVYVQYLINGILMIYIYLSNLFMIMINDGTSFIKYKILYFNSGRVTFYNYIMLMIMFKYILPIEII